MFVVQIEVALERLIEQWADENRFHGKIIYLFEAGNEYQVCCCALCRTPVPEMDHLRNWAGVFEHVSAMARGSIDLAGDSAGATRSNLI